MIGSHWKKFVSSASKSGGDESSAPDVRTSPLKPRLRKNLSNTPAAARTLPQSRLWEAICMHQPNVVGMRFERERAAKVP